MHGLKPVFISTYEIAKFDSHIDWCYSGFDEEGVMIVKKFIALFIIISLILVSFVSFADGGDGNNQTDAPHPPVAAKQM